MSEMITKTDLKNEYRFTEKMIEYYLPEPIVKPNPHNRDTYMRIWNREEVESIIAENLQLKAMLEDRQKKHAKRSIAAQKAVETKRSRLASLIDVAIDNIRVEKIENEELKQLTIYDKQDYEYYKGNWCVGYSNVNEQTLARWKVNYIRHNLTQYDQQLFEMKGKVGIHDEYFRYREAVMNKIAQVCPDLEEEIKRQIEYKRNMQRENTEMTEN